MSMKNSRGILSIALCLIFMLGMNGCGPTPDDGEIPVAKVEGGFLPEKDLELTVWTTQGSDYVPPALAKEPLVENWLVEKTRVKIENMFGNGGGQWEALLSRLIAGDNFPDLVVCGGGQGPSHFAKIAEVDKMWELTPELIQTYAPDIWERVPQNMWNRIAVDGKIYGIPYNFPLSSEIVPNLDEGLVEHSLPVMPNVGTNLWIRDDILKMLYPQALSYQDIQDLIDKAGKPIGDQIVDIPINSTEDMVKLFRDIQALNLTVGNKPVYAFGYAGADCWVPFARLGPEMMGYVSHNYTSSWNPVTQEIRIPLLEDIVKDGALLQNQLIRDKVFDPESLIHTDAQCKEKVLNGQYAVTVLSAVGTPQIINAQLESQGASFRYRPLYTSVTPRSGYEICKAPDSWGGAVGILKTIAAEDVPQVLNWMNTQFTEEFENVYHWGPKESGLYEDRPDGTRWFVDDRFNKTYMYRESNLIPAGENYGLQSCGYFYMRFMASSTWHPTTYNDVYTYYVLPTSGCKVSANGPYAADYILAPPMDAWSAEYANIDLVQTYWSTRSQWEDPFKLTLSAKSDAEFEQKWQNAVNNLRSVIDVDKMLKDMTDIARTISLD